MKIPPPPKKRGKKYQIIYADPPWKYRASDCIAKNSCVSKKHHQHYSPMSLKDICDLPIKLLTDINCLLFLWITGANLNEAFIVLNKWDFNFATVGFVWEKQLMNPGYYTLSSCEFCLIGKKGKIPQPRGARNIKQFLFEKRQKHSQKPNEIRKRIEKMFPSQNKIELFAREKTPGWDVWGNEVDSDIQL